MTSVVAPEVPALPAVPVLEPALPPLEPALPPLEDAAPPADGEPALAVVAPAEEPPVAVPPAVVFAPPIEVEPALSPAWPAMGIPPLPLPPVSRAPAVPEGVSGVEEQPAKPVAKRTREAVQMASTRMGTNSLGSGTGQR